MPDNITLIELPLGAERTVNAVLVEGDLLTLVDTGVGQPASIAVLERGLGARGYRIEDLRQIVITHAHTDHFGAARQVAERSGAVVVADAAGADVMATYPESFQRLAEHRIALCREVGAPGEFVAHLEARNHHLTENAAAVVADRILTDGEHLIIGSASWQASATPGHAPGELCFFEPVSRSLISGDIVLGVGGSNVTLYPYPGGRPGRWILDILHSLGVLIALDPRRILPGHGPEIVGDAGAIAARRTRVLHRMEQAKGAVQGRAMTAWDVSIELYRPPLRGTLPGVFQTIGYLDALEAEGTVESRLVDGKRWYQG